jgi:hypothetical protein
MAYRQTAGDADGRFNLYELQGNQGQGVCVCELCDLENLNPLDCLPSQLVPLHSSYFFYLLFIILPLIASTLLSKPL